MGYSENATDDRPRIPPGHPVSSEPGGESPNGVNRGGAGWLQNGSRSGAGKARFTHRAMDGIGWFRNFAHAGNLSVGGVFLLQKRALSLARRRPGACISSPCPRDFELACRSTAPCDGIAQLNGGGGAAQVSHRDRNNISAGPLRWHDDAGGDHHVDRAVVVAERRAEFEKDNGSGR